MRSLCSTPGKGVRRGHSARQQGCGRERSACARSTESVSVLGGSQVPFPPLAAAASWAAWAPSLLMAGGCCQKVLPVADALSSATTVDVATLDHCVKRAVLFLPAVLVRTSPHAPQQEFLCASRTSAQTQKQGLRRMAASSAFKAQHQVTILIRFAPQGKTNSITALKASPAMATAGCGLKPLYCALRCLINIAAFERRHTNEMLDAALSDSAKHWLITALDGTKRQ